MRSTEKAAVILIVALFAWGIIMMAATNFQFQGSQSNRLLLTQLGAEAATLNQAVQADGESDVDGVARNIQLIIRNTRMDFSFILLYLCTFITLAFRAGRLGHRFLATFSGICICAAALSDVLENNAILSAMRVRPFTDQVAVDISEFSEWKWAFFFLASLLLGLAIALNRRVSRLRRVSGGLFIAAGALGILGISRNRVALGFAIWMIDLGLLLVAAALLITVWKIYRSVQELDQVRAAQLA